MGPDFSSKMAVKSLTSQQIVRIHQLFRQAKFDDPSGHVSYGVFDISPIFIYFITLFPIIFLLYIPYFCHLVCPSYLFQCLSPAGEYNLRLGIIKELHPDMVATYSGRLWFNSKVLLVFFYLTSDYCFLCLLINHFLSLWLRIMGIYLTF